MDGILAGKLALVTGGGRGIGAAIARALASAGARVVVCGRTRPDLDAVAREIGGVAIAIDLARTGVTINALCPGWVETQMADEAVTRIAAKTGRSEDEARTQLAAMSPQRRMITPDEVAHAALMLCSDGARGIHGQTIVIDGGAVLK